jgi:pilus assembly protein CpaC
LEPRTLSPLFREARPLAPIVPASAKPRPGKGTTGSATSARRSEPSATLKVELGSPREAIPALPQEAAPDAPRVRPLTNQSGASTSARRNASAPDHTNDSKVELVNFETEPGLSQPPRQSEVQPAPAEGPEFGVLPPDSPFEAIEQSGTLRIRVRRSMLLRTKVDVYRTAIVDEAICDVVQFTPREISIIGRSVGQTHVTFWFDDPAMTPVTYLVEIAADVEQVKKDEEKYKLLEDVINEMFPDSKVYLVIVADKLLVKGQARDSEEASQIMTIIRAQSGVRAEAGPPYGVAEGLATPVLSTAATGGTAGTSYHIINMLRVPGVQQVALKVKIAELNRTAARGFGVDLDAAININDSAEGSQLFLASLLNASETGGTSLIASFSGDDVSIGVRYLQQRGVIRLLSEPTLVTLSGRPATFIAGGEFAVPTVVGAVGLNAVTTDFRAFGAIISFLPTVVDKDRIRLQVAPEFSQINDSLAVNGTPGLNVRAATTTVEMREGQTLAIAGLLEDSYTATNVGDVPFLAQIFGRRDTRRNETELIILVTPELVQPMEPEEVPPLPGFDVTEPTAGQFFLHGDIEGDPTKDNRSTVWPRLRKRYGMGGPAMTSGPFGHGQ